MKSTTEAILLDLRDRRINYAEFEKQMQPWLEMGPRGLGFGIRFKQPLEAQVPIDPSHVRAALAAFVSGDMSEDELVWWATMIDMLTEFGPGPDVSDEEADSLDPMWDVIVHLTCPRLFGELTPETVKKYDGRLAELEAELSRRAV